MKKKWIIGIVSGILILGLAGFGIVEAVIKKEYGKSPFPPNEIEQIEVGEGYPYTADLSELELPPDLADQIIVVYNYAIDASGMKYRYKRKITNLSDMAIEEWATEIILRNAEGKILSQSGGGCRLAEPLASGKTIYDQGGGGSSERFDPSPVETWYLELKVTYLKFV